MNIANKGGGSFPVVYGSLQRTVVLTQRTKEDLGKVMTDVRSPEHRNE